MRVVMNWKNYWPDNNKPSSRSVNPDLSRNSLVLLPSQMRTFFSCRTFASVLPLMNHSNSSAMPRKKTFLVVRSGNVWFRRLKRIWPPKTDTVPTPVRSSLCLPRKKRFGFDERVQNFCFLIGQTIGDDVLNQIQILKFVMGLVGVSIISIMLHGYGICVLSCCRFWGLKLCFWRDTRRWF